MRLLGLTGGVGMGKSTCAAWLAERGIPVVDTDLFAHQLTQPGNPALAEIASVFGPAILDPKGCLDRRSLARRVFGDDKERRKLESILHPKIQDLWMAEVEQWKTAGRDTGVIIIPLLFETHAEVHFDETLCVACSRATQASRLEARGWTAGEAAERIAAQMAIEEKIAKSDYVIWTEGSIEMLGGQLQRVFGT